MESSQENRVPPKCHVAFDKGYHVDESGQGRKDPDNLRVHPFSISVHVSFARFIQIGTVEAYDCKGKDELEEAENRVDNEGNKSTSRVRRGFFEGHREGLGPVPPG